jgi:hypothetical protein
VIVLIAVLSTACAAPGYDEDSLHDRLVQAGFRPSQATCVIDAMVDKFGEKALNAHTEPIAAEIEAERELLRECRRVATR